VVKREFLFDRQGKTVVLYAGLLDLAHERGVKAIRTTMLQAPSEQNGSVSIFKAVVELEDGRCFEGTGDASPTNVGRNIIPHALRMAETRAKARALRDALNINAVSAEELGDDDEPPRQPPRPSSREPQQSTAGSLPGQAPLAAEGGMAPNTLLAELRKIAKETGWDDERLEKNVAWTFGQPNIGSLSTSQAEEALHVFKAYKMCSEAGIKLELPPHTADRKVWIAEARKAYAAAKNGAPAGAGRRA
jgi:hypothetical protein